ncbi:MAG: NAD-dependent deacylase [Nitrospiraceae bacterium]|nr:NAD-dependent deacylase [Nitrospiraceae bacterium]
MTNESVIKKVQHKLCSAKFVAVLTGAGISADSGVPTFRGAEGLWKQHRAEDLASPHAFAHDPKLVWEWYSWRRELIATKVPNLAHEALATMAGRFSSFVLMTQNVDGLHGMAGSQDCLEMHGNIWKVRCTKCFTVTENRDLPIVFPPQCSACGGLLRPHIVWFGEPLDPPVLDRCMHALQSCDVLLVIGTSGVVQPAASFAMMVKSAGGYTVEINLDPTPSSGSIDIVITGKAKDVVPLLCENSIQDV